MERLTRTLEKVRAALAKLTASQRLLVGSVIVVLLMTLFVVQQYTAKPAMVPLLDAGYSPEDQQRAAAYLDQQQLSYQTDPSGTVIVPVAMRQRVLAQMARQPGTLPSDTRLLFNNIIDKQSWTKSYQQNRQLEIIALQNEIGAMISLWPGVRSAQVVIDVPDRTVLNAPARLPTAAVNVITESGLSQTMVDAIAALVAGSRAGLKIERVRIVDGTTGRQHRPREASQITATTTQELIAHVEQKKQEQLADMLRYIPGVIVTVQAAVDSSVRQSQTRTVLPEGQGSTSMLASETISESQQREARNAGEPGVRPNTGADIASAGGGGVSSTDSQSETSFENRFGESVESITKPGGHPTKINAVVNIPRSYFVEIWRQQQARAATGDTQNDETQNPIDPADNILQPIVDIEIARIENDVRSVVDTSGFDSTLPGEVVVSMIPTSFETYTPGFGPGAGAAAGGGMLGLGTGALDISELAKTIALSGLAVLALGLIVFTAVKANKREQLPSAAELVGIPPAFEADEGIIGEADAADSALTGIEMSEDSIRQRKVLEQVTTMIDEHPNDAARLVSRWMMAQN